MNNLFVTLDNDVIVAGNTFQGFWFDLPEQPIKAIELTLLNKKVCLSGFRSYNYLVERGDIMGKRQIICRICLVGRGDMESEIFEFDFISKKLKHRVTLKCHEFGNMLVKGWRNGLPSGETKSEYFEVENEV